MEVIIEKDFLSFIFIANTILAIALGASSPSVTFIFGDSLAEVGNNNYMQYSLAKSNYPWYGVDYSGGQATGRFTNGRTIGDIICIIYFIPPSFYFFSNVCD